jgi:hypothetical protein
MTQQTVSHGDTLVAETPAPFLPETDDTGPDNRRKLMIVGAIVGVAVLAIVAFFLLKGGGSSPDAAGGFVVPHHAVKKPAAAAPGAAPVVKLPKRVVTPVGRDPFKPLYVAPAAAPAGTTTTSTPVSSSTTTTPSTGGTTTTTTASSTPSYHPVWVQLRSISSTQAVFAVGYSNGKTLKAVKYTVRAPKSGSRTAFASSFALLSIRNGVATLQFGDGSPFQVDRQHNTMVVG